MEAVKVHKTDYLKLKIKIKSKYEKNIFFRNFLKPKNSQIPLV